MEKITTISVEQCCIHYSIEHSFIQDLDEHGLIKLKRSGKKAFIKFEQLADLEKYIRLHHELDINMAGLQAINHLLQRMQLLQNEIKKLQQDTR
jgi:hypothetical protein